ncbi:deoxyribonuclease V [Candidatus Parcubacteria bacterium]|nr:deoxyribonuclease V [Candidatus Parcubacteria bacterium]
MMRWDVSPKEAIEIQKELREEVVLAPLKKKIKTIGGADVSLNLYGKDLYAGIIVLSYPALELIEEATVKVETKFPYIPGLLSFREIPGLLKCWEKLSIKPDVLIVDGQGIAHPRRLGLATHFGVLAHVPTIGCAKSVLYGKFVEPTAVGQANEIIDPKTGEVIGVALKSKERSNPLIISPGHLVTVADSVEIVKGTLRGYRLPEPTRRAHLLVNAFRQLNS